MQPFDNTTSTLLRQHATFLKLSQETRIQKHRPVPEALDFLPFQQYPKQSCHRKHTCKLQTSDILSKSFKSLKTVSVSKDVPQGQELFINRLHYKMHHPLNAQLWTEEQLEQLTVIETKNRTPVFCCISQIKVYCSSKITNIWWKTRIPVYLEMERDNQKSGKKRARKTISSVVQIPCVH